MKKFIASTFVAAAAIAATAGTASAHHPELQATATCTDITVTAVAWTTDEADRRHNNDVRVLVDDKQVGAGAFTADNGYRFVVTTAAKPGEHTVRVVARAPWGPAGNLGSAFEARETVVSVPVCPEYAPVIPTTTRVVMETPTVVQAEVGTPNVVERAPAPEVVLAFTGLELWQKVIAAAGFLIAGAGLVVLGRLSKEA